MKKQILIKFYSPAGEFIKASNEARFVSFTKQINGGLGECIIDIAEKFDYQGNETTLGNNVEILISDKESVLLPEGFRKIYSGYISLLEPYINGNKEGFRLRLLGHYTRLSLDFLKDGTQTTLYTDAADGVGTTSPAAAADIGLVMRGVLDRYADETNLTPEVTYTTSSIPLIGQDMAYLFEQKTYRDAMDKIKSVAPSNYYYYIDENNIVNFKAKATTPTHKFFIGKHISSIKVERSMEKIRNFLLIWDGETAGIYKKYEDLNSISKYGRRAEKLTDYGIKDSDTADSIGNKFIAENKDPNIRVVVSIMDNNLISNRGYDIESIQPGDTCTFYNLDTSLSDIFNENMLITRVVYYLDHVEVVIEQMKSGLIDLQNRSINAISEINSTGVPETYS